MIKWNACCGLRGLYGASPLVGMMESVGVRRPGGVASDGVSRRVAVWRGPTCELVVVLFATYGARRRRV